MATSTHHTAKEINDEIDARFWVGTNYKPNLKLDMSNPTDVAMSKVWNAFAQQVKAEEAAGSLVLTHAHPEVAKALTDAAVANEVAAQHLDAAANAPDAATHDQHVKAAATAATIGQARAHDAAAIAQTPPIHPDVHAEAAREVAATPPPPPAAPAREHLAAHQARNPPALHQPDHPHHPEHRPRLPTIEVTMPPAPAPESTSSEATPDSGSSNVLATTGYPDPQKISGKGALAMGLALVGFAGFMWLVLRKGEDDKLPRMTPAFPPPQPARTVARSPRAQR